MESKEDEEEAFLAKEFEKKRGSTKFLATELGEGGLLSKELRAARENSNRDLEQQIGASIEQLESQYGEADEDLEREAMQGLNSRKAHKYRRSHHPSKEGKEMRMGVAFGAFWNSRGEEETGANLRTYGPGISFYFKWLKWMMLVFLLLSILQIPILVFNLSSAKYFEFTTSPVSSLSIGSLFTEDFFGVNLGELMNDTFSSSLSSSVQGPAHLVIREEWLCNLLDLRLEPNVTDRCFILQESLLVFYAGYDSFCMVLFMLMTWLAFAFSTFETRAYQDATQVLKVEDYSVSVVIPAGTSLDTVRSHFENVSGDQVFEVNIVDTGGKLIEIALREDNYRRRLLRMYGLAKGIRMRSIQNIECELELRELLKDPRFSNRMRTRMRLFSLVYLRCSVLTCAKRYAIDWSIKRLRRALQRIHPKVELHWMRFVGDTGTRLCSSSEGADEAPQSTDKGRQSPAAQHVSAYVTFSNLESKQHVLRLYRRKLFSRLWAQKAELQLEGKVPLVVTDPPPPNTLLWENIGYSKTQKRLRGCCAFLAVFILITVTAGISLYVENIQDLFLDLASLSSASQIGTSINEVCDGAFAGAGNATVVEAILGEQPGILLCLCDQVLLGLIIEEDILNDLVKPGAACSEFTGGISEPFLLQLGATAATLVVNTIIFFLLEATADFMKFTSILQREMTMMNRIFVLTLINTAFVVLLVNADFQLVDIDLLLIGNGLYRDISTGWFETVGLTVVLVSALNVLAPHLYPLFISFYEKIINNDLVKRGRAFNQTQYNTLMLGPQFRLSIRYAQILTMMFLVLMYSSGMPILYPIMFLSLLVTYAVDKFMFLKICRTPPAYTTRFGDWSTYMLENAVLLHVVIAVWTYTSPRLFPSTFQESALAIAEALQQRLQDEAAEELTSIILSTGEDPSSILKAIDRFSSPQAFPLLCVAGVILVIKVLRVFEETRKAARVLRLWCFIHIVKPGGRVWREEVTPRITQSCVALAEFYEHNKDACKPRPIAPWSPGSEGEDSEYEPSVGFDSSDEDLDSDNTTEFDSDSDTDDDIEEGDAEEIIVLKRAARERRRAEREARREARRVAKRKRRKEKEDAKEERRRLHLEAYDKRRAEKAQRRKEKEQRQLEKQERAKNKIEARYKSKEAQWEAKRERELEKKRIKKEKLEAVEAKLREKQELKNSARKKKEEAAQAKAERREAKRLAAEDARKFKRQKNEQKEIAKREAIEAKAIAKLEAAEAKEARARAKVEAREAKIRAKFDAKESKERERAQKRREFEEAKLAKEQAKLHAKETKEEARLRKIREAEEAKEARLRAKLEAKETKEQERERKRREVEEAKLAKEQAKLHAKETKEEARLRKIRETEEAKEARLRAKLEAKETKEQERERKKREAEEAKLAKERAKLHAKETKEEARLRKIREAEEAKEARARAKREAKETKEQERERKRREAEEAKAAKERAKLEAKESKEEERQRKIREAQEAKEARLRAKLKAKETKEEARKRKIREAQEAKDARARAKIEAKETKEEERKRKIREAQEEKEARARAKVEAQEAKEQERQRKIREAEEAKQALIQAKTDAKEAKIRSKEDAKAAKAKAKVDAIEARRRAKIEAREEKLRLAKEAQEAKERAKIEAQEAKERAKFEAKEAKRRAKVEALEAKERAKYEAKQTKERMKREQKEARQRFMEAKIEAKMQAKQERIEEKLRQKQARLDAKLAAKQKRIEEIRAAKEAKLVADEALRVAREEERKKKAIAKKEMAIAKRVRNIERYEILKSNSKSFALWMLTSIGSIISFFLISLPVYLLIEPSAWQYRRYKRRKNKVMRLREIRNLEEARLAVLRAEDSKLRAENPRPPIRMAVEREWIEGYYSYNLKYNPKYVRMLRA